MSRLTLTRQQAREIDAIATGRYGIPGIVLMENAGRGAVDVLLAVDHDLPKTASSVVVLCGKGNNAGDGLVIARHLEIRGVPARILLLSPPSEFSGDARTNYEIARRTNLPMVDLSAVADLPAALSAESTRAGWIVDALLGTGAHGEPREPMGDAIRWMNSQPLRRLAVDVPSGLDCDTGLAAEATVRADHTCTFVAPKIGFRTPVAGKFLGQQHVVSIGLPERLIVEFGQR